MASPVNARLPRWALFAAFWTLLALFFSSQVYVYQIAGGDPIPWTSALGYSLADWYVWAALAPFGLALARRLSPERLGWPAAVGAHLPLSGAFSLVHLALAAAAYCGIGWALGGRFEFTKFFQYLLPKTFHFGVLVYWIIGGVGLAAVYYRRYRERELRAAGLEAQLARSELQMLRMQLQPHFLFNTLNAISALVTREPRAADRMIERLGELLRITLESGAAQVVPLRQELEFLEGYLEIEKTRFRDRLSVSLDVDPETLDARVPNLILQPLVENAIRHGVAPRASIGHIEIRASREDGRLRLRVRDDGPGLAGGGLLEEGVGLGNTRARLRQLYGSDHRLELRAASGGGLEAEIVIPYAVDREDEEAAG